MSDVPTIRRTHPRGSGLSLDLLAMHVATVAVWNMHLAIESWSEEGWGNWLPEIGENDYDIVVDAMKDMLPSPPTMESYNKSFAVLEQRASDFENPDCPHCPCVETGVPCCLCDGGAGEG